MAIFRKVHVRFWSDSFVSSLKDKEKLFYLYLITNERTTQLGIYEITKKQIAYDLEYSIDTVSNLLVFFQKNGKILYNEKTNEIALKNWNKFNFNPSIKVKVLIDKEKEKVKDKKLIEYIYSIDTVSIHMPQEEEEEEEEEEIEVKEKKETHIHKKFDHLSITKEDVSKLVNEGYTMSQIDNILESIENYKDNKKYKSLYLTAKKWLLKEPKQTKQESKIVNNNW